MLKLIFALSFILLLSTVQLFSIDFKKIEAHVEKTPSNITRSTSKLSNYLTNPFTEEDEKFAAIYYWIGKNIKYDMYLRYKNRKYFSTQEIIDEVVKKKKGVCQHYSELFKKLAVLAGLETYVVSGYGKTDEGISDLAHAWNVIRVNDNWYFIDVTWGAGYVLQGKYKYDFRLKYFMVKPEQFIEDHMPFDPMWQLLRFPLKYHEFDSGKNTTGTNIEFFYTDSVAKYNKLDEKDQIEARIRRIKANGTKNILVKNELSQEKNYLSILIKNIDIGYLNSGNYQFNSALAQFNDYFDKYGNIRITDKKKPLAELNNIEQKVKKAKEYYSKIKSKDQQIVQKLKQAKQAVKSLEKAIIGQKKRLNE